ncbi:MAG TPA: HAD-IA family hydrolase [Anaerolineales bacterium]
MHTSGVTAILFDLDGTLHYNKPSSEHAFFDFAVRLGAADSREQRVSTIRWSHGYWAQSQDLAADLDRFEGENEAFWSNYARRRLEMFTCSAGQAEALAPEVSRCMFEEYKPQDFVPEDVPVTLQILREAGYTLGVVSNRTEPFHEQLVQIGLQDFFNCAIAGGEVSTYKPEPEIFYHALDRLGVRPGNAMYVGDNYYADVVGAKRAGIQPVLLDPDGIFPDAGCPTICKLGELVSLL